MWHDKLIEITMKNPCGPFWLCFFWILCFCFMAPLAAAAEDASQWEDAIGQFEEADQKNPPEPGQILFLGSSSIKLWDLEKYFPGYKALNRGFGGSQISDSLHYIDRIVYPYSPSRIAFYAGDNDIAAGKSAERVLADYKAFVKQVWKRLPETSIIFISIKPSLKRWHLVGQMREANRLIEALSDEDPRMLYLDIDRIMIGEDGRPRAELLAEDGLHLSPLGYSLWSQAIKNLID